MLHGTLARLNQVRPVQTLTLTMRHTLARDILYYLHKSKPTPRSNEELLSRFMDFLSENHRIIVCRKQECRKRLRRFGHVLGAVRPVAAMAKDVDRLIMTMEDICSRLLTPANLQNALCISSRERVRWTCEGKLRPIATKVIKDRGCFSLPLYNTEDVAELLMSPQILASWRA